MVSCIAVCLQIRLMADKYEEMLNAEGLSNGLVIDRALYGKFGDSYHSYAVLLFSSELSVVSHSVLCRTADTINVQVQLQCLVRNHKLDLPALPKVCSVWSVSNYNSCTQLCEVIDSVWILRILSSGILWEGSAWALAHFWPIEQDRAYGAKNRKIAKSELLHRRPIVCLCSLLAVFWTKKTQPQNSIFSLLVPLERAFLLAILSCAAQPLIRMDLFGKFLKSNFFWRHLWNSKKDQQRTSVVHFLTDYDKIRYWFHDNLTKFCDRTL